MTANLNFIPTNDVPNGDCIICLTPLSGKLTGHGSHVYHLDCIGEWVRKNPTCPLCQAAVNAETVFAQQDFYTRAQQTWQSIDFQEVASNLYEKAAPYLWTALPYGLRYGIPAYCMNTVISFGETMCEAGVQPVCSPVLIFKTAITVAGIALVINDHREGHLFGYHIRRRHGIAEIFDPA